MIAHADWVARHYLQWLQGPDIGLKMAIDMIKAEDRWLFVGDRRAILERVAELERHGRHPQTRTALTSFARFPGPETVAVRATVGAGPWVDYDGSCFDIFLEDTTLSQDEKYYLNEYYGEQLCDHTWAGPSAIWHLGPGARDLNENDIIYGLGANQSLAGLPGLGPLLRGRFPDVQRHLSFLETGGTCRAFAGAPLEPFIHPGWIPNRHDVGAVGEVARILRQQPGGAFDVIYVGTHGRDGAAPLGPAREDFLDLSWGHAPALQEALAADGWVALGGCRLGQYPARIRDFARAVGRPVVAATGHTDNDPEQSLWTPGVWVVYRP